MRIFNQRRKHIVFVIIAVTLGYFIFSCGGRETKDQMEMIGSIKPRNSLEISQSYWGIQAGTLDEKIIESAKDIGVKWTRLEASWSSIERVKDEYDWAKTDEAFDAVLTKGITPFVTLGGTNRLYSQPVKNKDPEMDELYGIRTAPPTASPEAMKGWLRFVRATVQRYRDRIKYWEVWNEPNHRFNWGGDASGKEYGRLLKETSLVIRQVNPDAIIIGGSTAGLDPEFTDNFLSMGTENLIDVITFHNYGTIPEYRIYRALEVWDVIKKYNSSLQLWQGECGFPSHSSTRDYRGTSPWGLNIQAKWLLRQAFTDIYFCHASLSTYFKLVHIERKKDAFRQSKLLGIDSVLGFPERGGSRVRGFGINEKCLLSCPGMEPKPAYYAYQNLCALIDSRFKPTSIKTQVKINDPGIFYGIGVADDAFPSVPLVTPFKTEAEEFLIAYWLPWHPQELVKPAKIDLIVDYAKVDDPVLVDLLDGKVYRLSPPIQDRQSFIFRDLPLFDYPCVITDRKQVELVK